MNSRRKSKPWSWVSSSVDSFPVNAVPAGHYRGNKIYVARAHHGGSLTPGRFSVPHRSAIIAYGSGQFEKQRYEILAAQPGCVKWEEYEASSLLVPLNAIEGGYSELFHEKLYIGRVQHYEDTLVGSVHKRNRTCTVTWEGQVLEFRGNFQILVAAG